MVVFCLVSATITNHGGFVNAVLEAYPLATYRSGRDRTLDMQKDAHEGRPSCSCTRHESYIFAPVAGMLQLLQLPMQQGIMNKPESPTRM